MKDHSNGHQRPLSAISHLFLSDVRGGARPVRRPPGQHVADDAAPAPRDVDDRSPVAILGAGLDANFDRRAASVAASLLGGDVERVGLAVIDADGLRLVAIEREPADDAEPAYETACPADAAACVAELSCDVDRWAIALPDAALPRAAVLLQACDRWTLATTADHEGVVAGYRTLKALFDRPTMCEHGPTVMLALPDADNPADAERAARKLTGVCRQFLDVGVEAQPAADAPAWASHDVLVARWPAGVDASVAWDALAEHAADPMDSTDFPPQIPPMQPSQPAPFSIPPASADDVPFVAESSIPDFARPAPRRASPKPAAAIEPPASLPMPQPIGTADEVIDLPAGASVADVFIARDGSLAATPVTPPMLPGGRLAVDREGGLVLVVAAAPGLADLAKIGESIAWVRQNRQLLAMALGQYRLAEQVPTRTRLLVASADAGADALRPLLGVGEVSVHAYRRLTWGGRVGLLLDAA